MPIIDYAQRLADIAETVYRWLAHLSDLRGTKREKVALYAEEIAATLARASTSFGALENHPSEKAHILAASRELARISGYVDTIVAALEDHLDGRKLAGVKRRLEHLEPFEPEALLFDRSAFAVANRLTSAEGFFRALADALRT